MKNRSNLQNLLLDYCFNFLTKHLFLRNNSDINSPYVILKDIQNVIQQNIMNNSLVLLAVIYVVVQTHIGVDISKLYNQSVFKCLVEKGYSFAIPRSFHSYGAIDTNAVQNLKNAKAAGMDTDVYLFPCKGKNPTSQVNQMISGIPSSLYGRIWIDVQTNPSTGCGWGNDHASNCAFLKQMAKAIKAKGKKTGYYSTSYFWTNILGSKTACPQLATDPLWYAHYDKNTNFNDFVSFGGWTKPFMKQYVGDTSLCGADVDLNYVP